MPLSADDQIKELQTQISVLLGNVSIRHRNNFWLGRGLVLLSIGFTAAVIVAGIYDMPKQAALLAIVAGIFTSIDSAFAIRDVGEFQRIIQGETENLLSPFKMGQVAEADIPKYQEIFYTLRKNFDQNLPKGSGMEAAKTLAEELTKAKK